MNTEPVAINSGLLSAEGAISSEVSHEVPPMGACSVTYINNALEQVRSQPSMFGSMFDMAAFEMDVMVINQYYNLFLSTHKSNELFPDMAFEAGGKAYQRAYKIAKMIVAKAERMKRKATETKKISWFFTH
jgi:hypothetical protein